ncbi:MAG: acylphosphatase, partial [Selenomonadaceae bacterium]|nr:acylphosphatase [Selenomonadaceae bacterium]
MEFEIILKTIIIFGAMILLNCSMTAEAATRIENIDVEIISESSLPPMIKERMRESVTAIGQQLIAGQILPLSDEQLKQKESTIHLVFDKILVGYTVNNVEIKIFDSTAFIKIFLLPWLDTIKKIQVNKKIEGMPPELENLILNDLKNVDEVFSNGLSGLPVAATDWTNGILKRRLNNFMEKFLPEFRADFDIKITSEENNISVAKIDLTVYPKLPVVRTISL